MRAYVFVCVHILQRRNSLLAITSSLMGAAAFVKSRTEKDSDGDLTVKFGSIPVDVANISVAFSTVEKTIFNIDMVSF